MYTQQRIFNASQLSLTRCRRHIYWACAPACASACLVASRAERLWRWALSVTLYRCEEHSTRSGGVWPGWRPVEGRRGRGRRRIGYIGSFCRSTVIHVRCFLPYTRCPLWTDWCASYPYTSGRPFRTLWKYRRHSFALSACGRRQAHRSGGRRRGPLLRAVGVSRCASNAAWNLWLTMGGRGGWKMKCALCSMWKHWRSVNRVLFVMKW